MTNDRFPEIKADMSPEDVAKRLRDWSQLWRLGMSLMKSKRLGKVSVSESGTEHEESRDQADELSHQTEKLSDQQKI